MFTVDDQDLLDELLAFFYIDSKGELQWSYKEDYSIDSVNALLAVRLKEYIKFRQLKIDNYQE